MNGRDLADRLRTLLPELKVLFMSGYTEHSIVHDGALGQDFHFLQKPFTPESLGRRVRELLDS
jgi:two-component SAPR family response regulator